MEYFHGFCRRHTRALLAEGAAYNIVSIYAPLISAAVEGLRRIEVESSSTTNPKHIAASMAPRGTCLACGSEDRGRGYPLRLVQATLHDARVRDAVNESSAVCLHHSLDVAESLDWESARFLIEEAVGRLGGFKDMASSSRWALTQEIWGADLDEPYRTNASRPGKSVERRVRPDVSDAEVTEDKSLWSPVLTGLRRRLSEQGCLVCSAQRQALDGYFDWLSKEIRAEPFYRWEPAVWLCRGHGWEFSRRGSEEAVTLLATAIRDHRTIELEDLAGALREKPPDRLVLRVADIPRRVREDRGSAEGRRQRTLRTEVWMALGNAFKPLKQLLSELLAPVLRERPCPACTYLETTADRNCDLLVRGLADPDTLRIFQASGGLCFRHLPQALGLCVDSAVLGALARTQRTRLELLQWELQEFQRKQSWTLRYEPKGAESDAWRRAIARYTGSELCA